MDASGASELTASRTPYSEPTTSSTRSNGSFESIVNCMPVPLPARRSPRATP